MPKATPPAARREEAAPARPRAATGTMGALGAFWQRVRTRPPHLPLARLEQGIQARRSMAIAAGLGIFILGFSLDDLRVLRMPGYLLGLGGALCAFAFGPYVLGRSFARARAGLAEEAFRARAAQERRLGALALLACILLLLAWLVVFSAGVPPWAA